MTDFQYGTVIGSAIGGKAQRVMVVAPDGRSDKMWWKAIVLRDDEPDLGLRWEIGQTVTLSTNDPDLTVMEELA